MATKPRPEMLLKLKSTAANIWENYDAPIIATCIAICLLGGLLIGVSYLAESDRADYIALCQQEMKLTEGLCTLRYKELQMQRDSTFVYMPSGR